MSSLCTSCCTWTSCSTIEHRPVQTERGTNLGTLVSTEDEKRTSICPRAAGPANWTSSRSRLAQRQNRFWKNRIWSWEFVLQKAFQQQTFSRNDSLQWN
jgi:hypothetical protein